jgi:RNA polymerase sigma-70 factor (ECF subfamily)
MESIDKAERIKLTERDDPEESLLNGELREILELSINSLPERCRQVFFLVKEEEMRYRDVAKCMGISEKTVHAQMCIAIKRIAKTINEHGLGNK